jgi:hypothetical protein
LLVVPTTEWLKTAFGDGFDSGNVEARFPGRRRRYQERKIGGSYRRVFTEAVMPRLRADSTVLELGPGKGSWSRAILKRIPEGRLYTADYVDLEPVLQPERYGGRLVVQQVDDNSFAAFPDGHFDWEKLDAFGWERGGVPTSFRDQPDEEIWWPRNSSAQMADLARDAGWDIVERDLGLLERDGLIVLRRPA